MLRVVLLTMIFAPLFYILCSRLSRVILLSLVAIPCTNHIVSRSYQRTARSTLDIGNHLTFVRITPASISIPPPHRHPSPYHFMYQDILYNSPRDFPVQVLERAPLM